MRNKITAIKKTLALVLALMFALSPAKMTVFAAEESKTAGELVAYNYESLTNKEKAILNSGLVKGGVYTFNVPTASDNTVTVDADNKTVTAENVVKDGYTWSADSAVVVYDGGEENAVLTASGNTASGAFTYDGNRYRVDVTYTRAVQVDSALQSVLLNGPYYFIQALDNIDTLDYNQTKFTYVSSTYKTAIKSLIDGTLPDGAVITTPATVAAVNGLMNQIDNNIANNNGSLLDVELLIFDYEYADSQAQYLFEHGAELKAKATEVYDYASTICADVSVTEMIDSFGRRPPSQIRDAKKAISALNSLINSIEDAVTDDWAVLQSENNPFRSGLSLADYQLLDGLATANGTSNHHSDAIRPELKAAATVSTEINRHNVVVNVTAEAVPADSADSAVTAPLTPFAKTVRVRNGANSAEVLAAVTASGIENTALASWGGVSEANYIRTTAGVIPDSLTDDITYTISYTPKTYGITYDFTTELPVSVPYGYNMTLPSDSAAGLVYDYYTADGAHYFQGDVLKITGSTALSRTEGKPWSIIDKSSIAADMYTDVLTADELAILKSDALKCGEVSVRVPTNADGIVTVTLISGSTYQVAADNYPSGITGLEWVPVDGIAVASDGTDAAGSAFSVVNNAATFTADDQIGVKIRYELAAGTLVSKAEVLAALKLPKTLAQDAQDQKDNMQILDDLYDDLGKLNTTTLNRIKIGVNGSDMGQAARDAVAEIIRTCKNPRSDSLYLYEYLTKYRANGLAYYYEDKNYEKIQAQVNVLNANLSTIYNDAGFRPLLIDLEYDGYYEMIGDIIDDLSSVSLAASNAAIDITSPELSGLAASVDRLIGHGRDFDSADRDVVIGTIYNDCTYRVVFKADGADVAIVTYKYGASAVSEPAVPEKAGFLGSWDSYVLNEAAETIVNAVYTRGSIASGLSLSLENEILINCYVYDLELPAGATYDDCRLVYTFNGQTTEIPLTAANASSFPNQNNKLVIAKCSAKEMADAVNVKVYNNNDLIKETDYSIKKYCDAVLASDATSPELKELCRYVLDYGAYAQLRFNHNKDQLANGGEFYSNGSYFVNDTPVELTADYNVAERTGNIPMGASLSLEYDTEINIYFSSAYTYDTVTVDGQDVKANVINAGGGWYRIVIKDTAAKDLNKTYTVYLKTTGGEECTLKYSALSYAYTNRNNEQEGQVCKALFNYYLASKAFFDSLH